MIEIDLTPFDDGTDEEVLSAVFAWWHLFSSDETCQTIEQDTAFRRMCDVLASKG